MFKFRYAYTFWQNAVCIVLLGFFSSIVPAATGVESTVSFLSGSSGQQATFDAFNQMSIANCSSSGTGGSPLDGTSFCSFLGGLGFMPGAPTASVGGTTAIAMQQFSTQADIQVNTTALSAPTSLKQTLISRLAQVRYNHLNTDQQTLLAVNDSADYTINEGVNSAVFGPFGLFLSGKGSWGDTDTNDGETGFNQQIYQVTAGLDYRFTNHAVGGIAFSYSNADNDFAFSSGHLEADIYRFAGFATFVPANNTYIDAIIGYSWQDFDVERRCSAPCGGFATSDSTGIDGDQYFVGLGTGYTHKIGKWGIKTYAKGDYSYTETDDYSLAFSIGNSTLIQRVGDQDINSLTSTLGTELSHSFNTSFGVIIPKLRGEWVHEYKNSSRSIKNLFQPVAGSGVMGTPSMTTILETASPERNWGNIGFITQMIFPNSITAFLGYEALIIKDSSNHSVSGGFRYEF